MTVQISITHSAIRKMSKTIGRNKFSQPKKCTENELIFGSGRAMPPRTRQPRSGSATLEYIIVSAFAVLMSLASIAFVQRMVKSKVEALAQKLNMTTEEFDFDFEFGP